MLCCGFSLLSSATTFSRCSTFGVATAISSRRIFAAFAEAYLISGRNSFAFTCFYLCLILRRILEHRPGALAEHCLAANKHVEPAQRVGHTGYIHWTLQRFAEAPPAFIDRHGGEPADTASTIEHTHMMGGVMSSRRPPSS